MLKSFRQLLTLRVPVFLVLVLVLDSPIYGGNLAVQLPDIGSAGSSTLTPSQERQLGQEFMHNIRQNLKLIDDPFAVSYLQSLADRLQPKLGESELNITVFLVDDPSINAFAGPGGYIGVHAGLVLAARHEGELASVLAHEIAHVSQRHLVRSFETGQKMSLSSMGAIIAGLILGKNNPQISEAVIASTVAGNAQQQLTYSRTHEQEADRVGLEMLANAGYDPRMMPAFFDILQARHRTVGSSAPEFLRTHPLTVARMADTRNRAMQYPEQLQIDDSYFQLMQGRVANLTEKTGPNPFTQTSQSEHISKEANQYYLCLAAAKASHYSQARKYIGPLVKTGDQRILFYYSAANIEMADNHPEKALGLLKNALVIFPGNVPLIELQARALLQLEKPQQAFEILESALRQQPEQTYLYQTYAIAASKVGNYAEGYRALGEQQFLLGNLHQAIDYLKQALKSGDIDKYQRISIEARLEELKSETLTREQNGKEKSE